MFWVFFFFFRGDGSPRNIGLFTSTSHQHSSGQVSQDDEVQKPWKSLCSSQHSRGGLAKRSLEPWTGLSGRPREDLTVAGESRSGPARARAMAQPTGRRKERERSLGNTTAAMSLEKVDILKETTQNLPCLEWKIGDHIERA